MANTVVWIDIPVKNLNRAIGFYTAVLDMTLKREDFPSLSIALVPHAEGEIGVCLFPASPEGNQPSEHGPLIYLNCEGRLADALEMVEERGGAIVKGRHSIGEFGWRAIVRDSEGNRIALRSREG